MMGLIDVSKLLDMDLRKEGDFVLHSGARSNVFWDIERLKLCPEMKKRYALRPLAYEILKYRPDVLVGIPTGGWILALELSKSIMVPVYQGWINRRRYVLIDDVLTTGSAIAEFLRNAGDMPQAIAVLVNRSEFEGSIFDIPLISGCVIDRIKNASK